jgi:hypothetical protein
LEAIYSEENIDNVGCIVGGVFFVSSMDFGPEKSAPKYEDALKKARLKRRFGN